MNKSALYFRIQIVLVVLNIPLIINAQSSFQKIWSNGEYLFGNDISYNSGCYYITGTSKTNTHSRLFIEKTNLSGDTLETFYYNATPSLEGKKIIPKNGFLYVAANSYSSGGVTHGLFGKIRENGEIVWSRTFGTTGSEVFNNAILADDSTIAIVGTVSGTGAGQKDILVTVIDTAGNIRWSKAFGTSGNEMGNSIIKTSDTCFVIVGTTDKYDLSGDMLVMKLSLSGTFIWARTFNIIYTWGSNYYSDQIAADIMETLTHFLVIGGTTKTNEFSSTDQQWSPVILKLGLDGSLIFGKSFTINSGHIYIYHVYETSDGSYMILGSMNEIQGILIKTNTSGITDWCQFYYPGTGNSCYTYGMCRSGGAFVITGSKNNPVDTSLYLVKTNSDGLTGCYDGNYSGDAITESPTMNPVTFSATDVSGSSNFPMFLQYKDLSLYVLCEIPTGIEPSGEHPAIYPNPVADYLYLDRIRGFSGFWLFDYTGNLVLEGNSRTIDFRTFSPGVYILKIKTGIGTKSYKVVKTNE